MTPFKKILFIINGFGLGNYSRCLPIIELLTEQGHQVEVVSSGQALDFITQNNKIAKAYALERLSYPMHRGHLSLHRLPLFLPTLLRGYFANRRKVKQIIEDSRPEIIITDSDYTLLGMKHKPFHVAINNASAIVDFYQHHPLSLRLLPQYLVERLDLLTHQLMADLILCPSFTPHHLGNLNGKIKYIFPLLRKIFYQHQLTRKKRETEGGPQGLNDLKKIVVMLSSSGIVTTLHALADIDQNAYQILWLGPTPVESKEVETITYLPLTPNNHQLLYQADYLLINGGQGSLAEAAYLKIPTLVIPIDQHAEQWANAKICESFSHIKIYRSDRPLIEQLNDLKIVESPHEQWSESANLAVQLILEKL